MCLTFEANKVSLSPLASHSDPLIVRSNHGGGPPSSGLPVHRHPRGYRSAAVPPGPHWDLPLWGALLEEANHQTEGTRAGLLRNTWLFCLFVRTLHLHLFFFSHFAPTLTWTSARPDYTLIIKSEGHVDVTKHGFDLLDVTSQDLLEGISFVRQSSKLLCPDVFMNVIYHQHLESRINLNFGGQRSRSLRSHQHVLIHSSNWKNKQTLVD